MTKKSKKGSRVGYALRTGVRDARKSQKQRNDFDVSQVRGQSFLRSDYVEFDVDPQFVRRCLLCDRQFASPHAFQMHMKKHEPRCVHCHLGFENWSQFERHLPFCRRRLPVLPRQRRTLAQQPRGREIPRPFQCALCRRKYEKHRQLVRHQIARCDKRYVRDGWVVKI